MTRRFENKTVLVTGSTSGIGICISEYFASAGARLMLSGRRKEAGEALVRQCLEAGGPAAAFLAGDITHSGFCNHLVESTVKQFASIDVLVNSAGVLHIGTAEETGDDIWRATFAANLDAAFYLSRAAIPFMRRQGGGNIVNVAGDWGFKGAPRVVAYCASKGALIQLTRAMAVDHARENIRVNAVCPGDVDTPMLDELAAIEGTTGDELRKERRAASRNGQLATPEDVASAIVFLASHEARHITGTMLSVDGGSMAG